MTRPSDPALGARFAALPGNVRGALWLLLSSVLFSVMALAAKVAGNDWYRDGALLAPALPSIEVTFFRSFSTLLATAPFLLRHGRRAVASAADYTRLLFATLWGFLVFGQLPDAWTWAGTGILLAATWYALRLQQLEAPRGR